MWYVYVLQSKDKRFYTGTTNNIEHRLAAHLQGKGGHFTRTFGVERLLYYERHQNKNMALKREAQIKCWTRKKKTALVEHDMELLKRL